MPTGKGGRPHKLNEGQAAMAMSMHRRGMEWEDIAVEFDCDVRTVRSAAERAEKVEREGVEQ